MLTNEQMVDLQTLVDMYNRAEWNENQLDIKSVYKDGDERGYEVVSDEIRMADITNSENYNKPANAEDEAEAMAFSDTEKEFMLAKMKEQGLDTTYIEEQLDN